MPPLADRRHTSCAGSDGPRSARETLTLDGRTVSKLLILLAITSADVVGHFRGDAPLKFSWKLPLTALPFLISLVLSCTFASRLLDAISMGGWSAPVSAKLKVTYHVYPLPCGGPRASHQTDPY